MSRRRSGRRPASAGPAARTAADARTRPRSVLASMPGPAARSRRTREPSKMVTPRCARRGAKPERQARRLDGGGRGIEGPGAEDRRVTAGPHLGFGQRPAGVRDARARRRRRRPSARSRRAPEPSRPVGSRPRWYQASTRCSSHQRPIPSTASCAARVSRSAAASPKRRRSAGRPNHIAFTKPPLRPLGPAPQRSDSSRTTRASGSSSVTNQAAHIPVYPPPTTTTSAAELFVQRGELRDRSGLLLPPASRRVPDRHRPQSCGRGRPGVAVTS